MKEFKTFIMRGNVVDLAIGIIIGVAFGAIVTSLVNDVIMPPIGLLLGKVDFANLFVVLKEGLLPDLIPPWLPPKLLERSRSTTGASSIR